MGCRTQRSASSIAIDAGGALQSACIERFISKLRQECLDGQSFETLVQTHQEIAQRQHDFNDVRPHSSLWHTPRASFAS
ncbi:integrase core domain-containing protein [Corticibacter populi]|uniref:integrase core domain-containing protein n=1 Tax=Corticibacter populi TaxID=1550736 RepID=UPI003BF89066